MKWYALSAVCLSILGFLIITGIVQASMANVTVTVTLAQCADGIDNDGDFLIDYPDDLECSSAGDNDENVTGTEAHATTTISMSGGDFSFDNQDNLAVDFTFPHNFHTEAAYLSANSYTTDFFVSSKPALSGKSFIGKTYDFTLYTSSTKQKIGQTLKDVTIVLRYTDSDVSGITESSLAPYRWGDSDSSWQLISDSTLDTTNNTLTSDTRSFNAFSILGDAVPEYACSDGIDNDSDGKIDYPDDPGCSSATDDDETDPVTTPPSGGGGGGSYIAPRATVVFKGKAYPGSNITLLKDAQRAAITEAGPDANFEVRLSGLSAGTYTFGVWAEDARGDHSITHTFTVSVTSGVTTIISGIFVPPTITVDKYEVRRGDILNILGQSVPDALVSVFINSENELIKITTADVDGLWLYKFDTLEVDYGSHATRARAAKDDDITTFSQLVRFKVGTKTVEKEEPRPVRGDSNNDGRVDIVDFSIAAYWYKRPSPPSNVDLNNDGAVDLIDFSIMAFYWTG